MQGVLFNIECVLFWGLGWAEAAVGLLVAVCGSISGRMRLYERQ